MKKWIVGISVIIIILLILIIILLSYLQADDEISELPGGNQAISSDLYDYEETKTELLTDKTSFYIVTKCISNYLDMVNKTNSLYYGEDANGNYVKVIDDSTIASNILDILDKAYISENNITMKNVYDFVENVETKQIFIPLKMNILPGRVNETYAVYGMIQDLNYQFIKYLYIIVTLDIQNHTYAIQPILDTQYNDIDEITLQDRNKSIEENDNNLYQVENITNEYVSNQYLDSYKKMLLGNPDLAYEYLDEEYKVKRFGDIDTFKKYIQERNILRTLSLKQYSVEIKDEYTQYTCIDQNGNYYIFKETAPMQYTVILDTYTIDLPEFTQKYANSTEEEKVLLNLQKFFEAINQADYAYAYSKLDETFKANNFKTQQDFESYVKSTFFEQNKLSASNPQRQNDIYLYDLSITDATGKDQNTLTKTFVMQLKEGTDFVMSFGVN